MARLGLAVLLGLALLLGPSSDAQAASVTHLYLLSTFSTSVSPSGSPPGITAPFTLTGTGGVELGLNASAVATSQTGFSGSVSTPIDNTVTYQSHSGGIDSGEPGPVGTRVNSEVGRLDDVGFVSEGSDAALNIDFGSHAKVILKIPTGGFNTATKNAVLARSDFGGGDSSPIDQGVVGPAAVPEPTTFLLWGTTAAGLALARWRRRYRAAQ